jgi:hypothetical protein
MYLLNILLTFFFKISIQEEIAKSRNLVTGTIEGHLGEAVKAGCPVDLKRGNNTLQLLTPLLAETIIFHI